MNGYTDTGNTNNGFNNSPRLEHKRYVLSCVVIALWIVLGLLGYLYETHFYDLSVYFLSLTGFVGAYIISESKRPSISTTIFRRGKSSTREIIIYFVTGLWLVLGILSIISALDLLESAAYFSALTPYISTYLIGVAYKPDLPKSAREITLGNNNYSYFPPTQYQNTEQTVDVVSQPQDVVDP